MCNNYKNVQKTKKINKDQIKMVFFCGKKIKTERKIKLNERKRYRQNSRQNNRKNEN